MTTFETVKEILSTELSIDPNLIDPTDLISSSSSSLHLGADSMDRIEIGMSIEDAFEIHLSDAECLAPVTVQDLCDLIDKKKGEKL